MSQSDLQEVMDVIDLKSQRHLEEHGQEQGRSSAWELPHGSKTVPRGAQPVTLTRGPTELFPEPESRTTAPGNRYFPSGLGQAWHKRRSPDMESLVPTQRVHLP